MAYPLVLSLKYLLLPWTDSTACAVQMNTLRDLKMFYKYSNSSNPIYSIKQHLVQTKSMEMASRIIFLALVALASTSPAMASDPNQLGDSMRIQQDAQMVTVDDFFFSGLDKPGNTSNAVGSKVTPVSVAQIPGLNTLGISLVRIDYAPFGLNPPHTHPRATEVLVVLKGALLVGFVTSNPENKHHTKVLNKGDVFVFPQGLIHYQYNNWTTNSVAIAGLSSQNPGVITVGNAIFGSTPPISDDVLAKAFHVSKETVDAIRAKF
ncbi:hypothetical protein ZIOFF_019853 [Zingiber officinale]|uniref:Germin-like protein n=1 Tax=Zingiber officinale TaxID=94328 RepID=A0A8J5LBX1_ZINOF|nr:hypothetical protein ZIOFF_019853 [Zingiber officinale]